MGLCTLREQGFLSSSLVLNEGPQACLAGLLSAVLGMHGVSVTGPTMGLMNRCFCQECNREPFNNVDVDTMDQVNAAVRYAVLLWDARPDGMPLLAAPARRGARAARVCAEMVLSQPKRLEPKWLRTSWSAR